MSDRRDDRRDDRRGDERRGDDRRDDRRGDGKRDDRRGDDRRDDRRGDERRGDERRDERRGDDRRDDRRTEEPRRDDRRGDDRRDDRRTEPRRDDRRTEEPRRDDRRTEEPRRDDRRTEEPRRDDRRTEEPRRDDRRTEEPRRDDRRTEEPRRDDRRTEEPRRDDRRTEEPRRDDRRPPSDFRPAAPASAAPPASGGYKSMFKAVDNRTCKQNEETTIRDVAQSPNAGDLHVHTNFVALEVSKTTQIYQYNVSFEFVENAEDLAGNQWKEELINKFLDDIFFASALTQDERRKQRQVCVAYAQTILSPKELPARVAAPKEGDNLYYLFDSIGRERITRKYRLSLSEPTFRKPFFEGTDRAEGDWLIINNVVDAAFSVIFPSRAGPKLIDLQQSQRFGDIVIVNGCIPTACEADIDGKKIATVQIAPAVRVVSSKTCLDSFTQLLSAPTRGGKAVDPKRAFIERYKGKKVCTLYATNNVGTNKGCVYKFIDVDLNLTASSSAGMRKNPEMTYAQYFKERYSISLRESQPFVKCRQTTGGRSRPVFIPAQVLFPMDLDDSQKQQLPQLCSIYPNNRMNKILEILHRLQNDQDGRATTILSEFGLTLGKEPLKVKGTILKPVKVLVCTGGAFKTVDTGLAVHQQQFGFARELQGQRFPPIAGGGKQREVTLVSIAEERDARSRARVWQEILQYMKQVNCPSVIAPNPVQINTGSYGQASVDLSKFDKTGSLLVCNLHAKETGIYKDVKTAFYQQGYLSQVIAKEHASPSAFKMIAQQVVSKEGNLNWVADMDVVLPNLAGKGVMIVGIDAASNQRDSVHGGKSSRQDTFVAAFVAFFVVGKQWHHYCNHYVNTGRKQVLYQDADAATETETTASSTSHKGTASSTITDHMKEFLVEAKKHFTKIAPIASVVVARGSTSDGEIDKSSSLEIDAIRDALAGMPYVYLAAQKRNNTRFMWKVRDTLRNGVDGFVNPPRGFTTTDGINSNNGRRGFYVNGANCTLGHAKSTKFIILDTFGDSVKDGELANLFYTLSFLFPNKTDGLPYPLPLKCADKYANLFVLLDVNVLPTLPENLRTKMHYL